MYQNPKTVSKQFQKDISSRTKVIYICVIPGMSLENLRKIFIPELAISLYLYNVSKEVSQLTDWQTYKKFRIIWNGWNNMTQRTLRHKLTQAGKLACMHAMCLCARAHNSANLGQIREIKISMESGEHAGPLWAQNLTQAHKLVCMHVKCLRACVLGPISWTNGLDKKDEGIYGIVRTYPTFLST